MPSASFSLSVARAERAYGESVTMESILWSCLRARGLLVNAVERFLKNVFFRLQEAAVLFLLPLHTWGRRQFESWVYRDKLKDDMRIVLTSRMNLETRSFQTTRLQSKASGQTHTE